MFSITRFSFRGGGRGSNSDDDDDGGRRRIRWEGRELNGWNGMQEEGEARENCSVFYRRQSSPDRSRFETQSIPQYEYE